MVVNRFFTMKKRLFLVSVIMLLGLGAFLVSCSRTLSCTCTTTDNVSQSTLESDMQSAISELAFDPSADCSDLAAKLEDSYGYYYVSCN